MIRVAVVTVGRSDYSYYRPILRRLQDSSTLTPHLVIAAAHLVPAWGATVDAIEPEFEAGAVRVHMSVAGEAPAAIGASMGLGVAGFAAAYERLAPGWVLLLGDRYEMLAAAVATLPFNVPVAHIAGGDVTTGAIDDAARHAITKLSHLHFVATTESARRVIQMGEAPDRVIVSGAPSLDAALAEPPVAREALEQAFGIDLAEAPLLVTYHPVTREPGDAVRQIDTLLGALERTGRPVVFTMPNADAESASILDRIRGFVDSHPRTWLVPSFGPANYYSMLRYSAAMVGNSSSGIIEAASFALPVVNVGQRQAGRTRAENVVDVECEAEALDRALRRVTQPSFRPSLAGIANPYGRGDAAATIVAALEARATDRAIVAKGFYELERNR